MTELGAGTEMGCCDLEGLKSMAGVNGADFSNSFPGEANQSIEEVTTLVVKARHTEML